MNYNNYPKDLPYEEQQRLFQRLPDKQARNTLIETNMGLVLKIAARYSYTKIEKDDLVSMGTIGLINAVDEFDYKRGTKFSSCAYPYIRNAIRQYLQNERKNPQMVSLEYVIRKDEHENLSSIKDIVEDKNASKTIDILLETEDFLEVLNNVSNQLYKKSIKRLIVLIYTIAGNTQRKIVEKFGIPISLSRIGQLSVEARELWKRISKSHYKSENNDVYFYKEEDMICLEIQGHLIMKRPFEMESFNDFGDILMEYLINND